MFYVPGFTLNEKVLDAIMALPTPSTITPSATIFIAASMDNHESKYLIVVVFF